MPANIPLNMLETYTLMAIGEEIVPRANFFRDRYFPTGAGDLFASVLTGGLVGGIPLFQAAQAAAEFVRACVSRTLREGLTETDGVDFEPLLGQLTTR